MQFVGIIVGLIVVAAAITLVLPSRWSWLPVALAVALPVVVVLAGQSTEDDSPESLAIAYAVVFSAPIVCGTAVGSGIKWALRSPPPARGATPLVTGGRSVPQVR